MQIKYLKKSECINKSGRNGTNKWKDKNKQACKYRKANKQKQKQLNSRQIHKDIDKGIPEQMNKEAGWGV